MKKALVLFGLLFSVSSISFAAPSLSPMTKSEAQKVLSDKTITTIAATTPDGSVVSDSFTGYFSKDGKVKGKLSNKPANEPQADSGVWKVSNNGLICYTYDHWNNGKEKCVTFYKLSNAVLIVNSANGFESLILDKQIQSGDQVPA